MSEKKTGTKFTVEEIYTKEINEAFAFDMAMKKRLMVTGTPTIFIDGMWDSSRFLYKKFIPKK